MQHVDQALDLFEQGLKQANLPPEAAGMAMMLAETVRNDEMNCPAPSLERLIGHKPQSLADYLKQTYFSAKQLVA